MQRLIGLTTAVLLTTSMANAATLGIPGQGSTQSGVGVISGWKCQANGRLTVRFNGGRAIPLVYGTERPDVRKNSRCPDNAHDNVGFVAIWNWGNLDAGRSTAVVYDNGVEFARSTFTVVTTGVEFLQGVTGSGTATLSNGQRATLQWSQAAQSFVATAFTPLPVSDGKLCTTKTSTVYDFDDAPARWTVTNPCETWPGYAGILHIDITPLSSEGFYADEGDFVFVQGGVSWDYVDDGALYWVDRNTREFFHPFILFGSGNSNTKQTTLVAESATNLNFSEPFQMYYNETLIFEFP